MKKIISVCLVMGGFFLSGCASSTEGGAVGADRRQFLLLSEGQVNDMAAKGYNEMKQEAAAKGILNKNTAVVKRVNEVARRLIPHTRVFREDAPNWDWESNVISADDINAFAMPGGKMMVYTGLVEKLNLTDGELAAVMGHEMAHALREHGRERLTQEMLKQGSLQILVGTGKLDPKYAAAAAQVSALLVSMPHGRKQESEADRIGIELAARAGYDPSEALTLWQKMGAAGGSKAPEFRSTHPSDTRRQRDIQELLPKVMPLYRK